MEVLKVLWDEGPGTVREVNERLSGRRRRWAYTTVQTLLNRLREKGYVTRNERDMAHVFRAGVSRERLLRWRLDELSKTVCDGETTPLVQMLVEGRRFSAEEIAALRRVIDEHEVDGRDGGRRKKR